MAAYTFEELQDMILVSMGDYKTSKGDKKLITRDLGSCVGVALWDSLTGIGGLLHIMLPEHDQGWTDKAFIPAKFADTGIEEMVHTLVRQGAGRTRLTAKLAGGAHMFRTASVPENRDISSRNVAAVQKKLHEMQIPVLACEVGEYSARTMVFEPGSGVVTIVRSGKKCKEL